jgi:hypothetical protein
MTTDPIPADRIAQIEAREDALAILHGPSKSRGDYCICDRHLSRCGPWADMQSTAFLIGQLREAQAESQRLSTYEPCEPCKADDHDRCTGNCPSLCCALAEAQERVAALEGVNARLSEATALLRRWVSPERDMYGEDQDRFGLHLHDETEAWL